jgi:hypothetical protein
MRAATGFDTDEQRRQLRYKGHQGIACQPFAPQNLSGGVSPHEVKDFLARSMVSVLSSCFMGLVLLAVL